MSQESLEQFYQVVKEDLGLQEQLKVATGKEEFLNLAVALGGQKGYSFTTSEFDSMMKEREGKSVELSDSELSSVAGGGIMGGGMDEATMKSFLRALAEDPW